MLARQFRNSAFISASSTRYLKMNTHIAEHTLMKYKYPQTSLSIRKSFISYIDKLVVLSQLPAMALIFEANKCIVGEPNSNSNT